MDWGLPSLLLPGHQGVSPRSPVWRAVPPVSRTHECNKLCFPEPLLCLLLWLHLTNLLVKEYKTVFVCVCLRLSVSEYVCVSVCVCEPVCLSTCLCVSGWPWKEYLDKVFLDKLWEQSLSLQPPCFKPPCTWVFCPHTHCAPRCTHTYTHFALIGRSLSSYWMGPPNVFSSFIPWIISTWV